MLLRRVVLSSRLASSCLGSIGACAALLLGGACGGPDPAEPLPLYTVAHGVGGVLTAPAGSELPQALTVLVRTPDSLPARGVAVRFEIVAGRGATLSDTLVATNAAGIGTTRLRLGGTTDTVVIAGSVRGQEDRGVTFFVRATPGAALVSAQPASLASGDTVTLRGRGLTAAGVGAIDVLFGTARGRLAAPASDTLLRVVVPPCLPAGAVAVTVRAGSALTNALVVPSAGAVAPLALAVGEGATVRGSEMGCLRFAAESQRFIVIPQFAPFTDTVPTTRPFALTADAPLVAIADGEVAAAARPAGSATVSTRATFEGMLRAAEQAAARSIVEASGRDALRVPGDERSADPARRSLLLAPATPPTPPTPPPFGSTRAFQVLTRLDGTAFATTTGRLRYAGAHILVYEDVDAPAPLVDSTVAALGALFDATLYDLDVSTFGAESDIDGNGRVVVLLTPLVNALTPAVQCAASGFVPGFFYGVDLDTRHKNSNKGEIFYAFVPDPQARRSCAQSLTTVLGLLPATFLHEFQHMISFNQHVLVRRAGTEQVWLNEGLSHFAEELGARHYDARLPAPRGRTFATQLLPDSAVPFIRGNLENAALWLITPFTNSLIAYRGFGTLEERGVAWLFVRWLGAQKGDAVYARLVQSGLRGGQNVESATGESFASLFADFSIAVYADSIPGVARSVVPLRYRLGPRTLRELVTRVSSRSSFPLTLRSGPAVGTSVSSALVQDGAGYYLVTVPRGGLTLRYTAPNDAPFPPPLVPQLGVVRITP